MSQEDPGRLETARALLAVIPDMVFRVSRDGTFLDFLPARGLEPIVPPRDFLGKKVPEVLPSFGREALALIQKALATGEEQRLEYKLPGPDGAEERHYESRLVACGSDEVVVLVRDVTEQKRREEDVSDIARALWNTSGDGFFRDLVQRLGRLLGADTVMVGALEPGDDDVVRTIAVFRAGELVDNFIYPLGGSPCEAAFSTGLCSYASGVSESFPRDEGLRRMGVEGYVGAPLFDSQGRPLGILNALFQRPIDNASHAESVLRIFATRAAGELERMASEEELRLSEQLNRRIVESMPGGIVRASATGRVIVANEAAREFLDEGEGEGSVWITEDGVACERGERPLELCLATGRAQPPRVYGVREAGETRWGLFTAVPVEAAPDEGAVLMFVDITDRRLAQEKQRELEARVQHAQKLESLGVLAGGIAHDFNNLLTGILGNANLARRQSDDPRLLDRLEKIERAAERAAELTNQMLAYAGKGTFVVGPLSLNRMIEELVPLLESSISKKAELRCELAKALPEIGADRSQLEQVLMNLVTNASDALSETTGEIRVATRVEADDVVLEVSDTGVGMDPATKARMFEPFYTTKFTGRGLGLAAVEGIARGHGASIQVTSGPGTGTRFTLRFPPLADGAAIASSPPEEAAKERRPATVLVIDDEETVRELAKTALEGAGYQVLLASDGIEGLERFSPEVDVVVLDLSMPRQGGEETLARIRERSPGLPVLLTSGYSEQDARSRAVAKVSGFIHKPFRADEIVDKVDRAAAETRS